MGFATRFICFAVSLSLIAVGIHLLLKDSPLSAVASFSAAYIASVVLYNSSPCACGTLTTAPHRVGLGRFAKWLCLLSAVGFVIAGFIWLGR